MTTRERRNSRIVGFSDLFSGMFAAAHALIHSWQTFTFFLWAGVLHFNEVFNVCRFACFKEDSSICLMCETAERCLSRTDFWRWSTTTLQVEQNYRRLLSAWNFLWYCLARSCGVMLNMAFPLVFLLIQTYPFSKRNHGKVVLPPNKSKKGTFFSLSSSDWLYFFQSRRVLYEKLEHRPLWPAAWNAWNALLIGDFILSKLFTTKWWLFAMKMYYI